MLDVKKNRLNYGEILSPPKGYKLKKAVGTTYSLDLYALLALPVSMIYSKDLTGDFSHNRYDVLDSIRKSKDIIDLFCQRGKIHVPEKYNNLLAFMEDAIIEVTPPNFRTSFHPKIWVLKFQSKDEIFFRLIVLSRNLTFDRSWDVAFYCEGTLQSKENINGSKIANYLKYFYNTTHKTADPNFLEQLAKTSFQIPEEFSSLNLYPILNYGQSKEQFSHPLYEKAFDELIIISPFIDKTTLQNFKRKSSKLILISRQEELDLLDQEVLNNIETYCINPLVVSGEDAVSEELDMPLSQNLHAKIFIGKNRNETEWYLGSANSTRPAFERNVEFLINFQSNSNSSDFKSIKDTLIGKQSHLFQPYEYTEGREDQEDKRLEKLIREFSHCLISGDFSAKVSENSTTPNYDLTVNAHTKEFRDKKFTVKIVLPNRIGKGFDLELGSDLEYIFENISLVNLSKFLVFEIYYEGEKKGSIAIKLKITLPEEREDTIFQNLISNKDRFYKYLQFLLAPEDFTNSLTIENILKSSDFSSNVTNSTEFNVPVYENLLLAASRDPDKLKEVDRVIKSLENINPEIVQEFKPIWEVFKEFTYAG